MLIEHSVSTELSKQPHGLYPWISPGIEIAQVDAELPETDNILSALDGLSVQRKHQRALQS